MESMNLKFDFICADNYEALIHRRYYGVLEDTKLKLEDIFK